MNTLNDLSIPLERDLFTRTLLRHLAGALQEIVGINEAAGFVSRVGQSMGEEIDSIYKTSLKLSTLNREQMTAVLIDLKRRINGEFYIIEENEEKIVFGNKACPFADKVNGRPSLCMMTSNVFGYIAANNLGYGKVALENTIAQGHKECRVVLYLKQTQAAVEASGREYFKSQD